MKFKLYLLGFICFFHFSNFVFAETMPLPDGVIAPDFTITDINGNSHTLYDYLDAGIDVILDFGATWCGPCWNYHQTHILADIYNASEAMVIMIEADPSTPTSCIYGNCGNTIGNWTIGTPYPIVNLEGSELSVSGDYAISYYPTLYGISAYNKKVYEIGQASRAVWQSWLLESFQLKETAAPVIADVACAGENTGSIDVTISGGYINRSFRWSNNRTTEDLNNLPAGDYFLTVTDAHNYSIELGPYTVGGPATPLEPIAELIIPLSCANQATGAISVNGFGGTPGYSFLWSNGAGGTTISGLAAGMYTVTVTDAADCTEAAAFEVTSPPFLELYVISEDETCGEGNGQLLLAGGGGTPVYLYNIGWGSSAQEEYDNLSAGTYIITLTDANGCSAIETVEIENTPSPVADGGGDAEIPCDETEITLDGSGSSDGIAFNYLWTTDDGNIVEGDSTLMPLVDTAGTYVLLITNTQNGCSSTDTIEVSEIDDQTIADAGIDKSLDCANSSIRLDGSDSSADTLSTYTYAWTGPAGHILEGDSSLMPLVDTVGEYILEVTNTLNGCVTLDTVSVGEDYVSPDAEAGPEMAVTCLVNSLSLDGSASSSDTSNTFSYLWTSPNGNIVSGDTTTTPLVNTPGYYILEVLNTQNGCTAIDSVLVNDDTAEPGADAGPTDQLDCANTSTALNGSSSSPNNINYSWSTANGNIVSGENSANPVVDQAGTYLLIVTDIGNGCESTATVEITQDIEAPVADAGPAAQLDCINTNVTLSGSSSSASNNTSYAWSTTNGNIINGANSANPVVDQSGTYLLTVTDEGNGCQSTASVEITQDIEAPGADAGPAAQLDCINTNVTLNGSTASGNNTSYLWSTANGNILSGANSTNPLVDQSGTYLLTVTDEGNGCQSTASVEITQDIEAPGADAGPAAQLDCINTNVTLNGSTASSNNTSYSWSTANGNIINGANSANPVVDQSGTYLLTVTDEGNGCQSTASVEITQDIEAPGADAGPAAQLDCINTNVTLNGSSTSGNNTSYLWSTANGNILSGANSTNPVVDQSGTYLLTVTDQGNGCQSTASVEITQDVEAPGADAGPGYQLNCINTYVSLSGSSASSNNTSYLWSTANGNILSGANSANPLVDQSGSYLLTVTDESNGCQSTASVDITQDIELPVADAGPGGQLDCAISQLTLDGSQSSFGNHSYLWISADGNILSGEGTLNPTIDQPGTYTLDVTNLENGCSNSSSVTIVEDIEIPTVVIAPPQQLNCAIREITLNGAGTSTGNQFSYLWLTNNGSILSGGTSLDARVASAGNYTLTVHNNQNSCFASSSVEVDEAPELEAALMNSTDNLCYGDASGVAAIQAIGGSGNYFYNWSNGNTTAIANNLAAGIYIVSVSDEGGCVANLEVTISEPPLLLAQVTSTDETANAAANGTATVIPIGGTPPFSYAWSNGGTTQTINNLLPDNYTVVVTDQHGCTIEAVVTVNRFNCALNSNAIAGNLTCFGANDGTAAINIIGGEGPYVYQWSNGAQTPALNNLSAGTYTVTVTDANNCPVTANITIEEPDAINVSVVNRTDVLCYGEANGSIELNAIGGSGTLRYQWTNGNSGNQANNLPAGMYNIVVTDENDCTSSIELEINEPSLLEVTKNSSPLTAAGANDGTASVAPSGGTPPYSYLWNTAANTSSITNLSPGTYTVVVTDDHGCSVNETIVIQSFDCSSFSADIQVSALSCFDSNDGAALPLLNGGIAPFQYEWSNGSNMSELNDLSAGTYTLTITDGGNCPAILSFTIERPLPIELEETNLEHPDCFGDNTGSIQIMAGGGTGTLNYSWSSGNNGPIQSNLTAGIYELEITDENACVFIQSFELEQPLLLQTTLVDQTNIQCVNDQTGEASVEVEGGVPPYTYLWSNGGTGASTDQLGAGTHQLVVTDANGCETTFEVNIEANDQTAPSAIAQNITINLDANGQADLLPAQIDNGSSDNCGAVTLALDQNQFDCANLGINTVTLTVTDEAGNRSTTSAIVTVVDDLPPQLVSCPSDMESNDCSGQITYALPEATDNCELFAPVLVSGLGSGATFPFGTTEEVYRFTDASGNEVSCSFMVTVINNLEAEVVADAEVCFGQADAEATINASGGNPAYEYLWSDGQTTATASGLSAGAYTFTVTDATGCTYQEQISITELPELTLIVDELVNEVGSNNMGSIDITVSGGTPPYQYFWSKEMTYLSNDEDISNLSAGTYQVEVVDAKGCIVASETLEVGNLTATIDLELDRQLQVFPNPTAGMISLVLRQPQAEEVRVEVYDAVGHRLLLDFLPGNQQSKRLDLTHQPAGLYWIKISVGERIASRRIVVQR